MGKIFYSKKIDFRLGAEPRAIRSLLPVNEDGEMAKATTHKINFRRVKVE